MFIHFISWAKLEVSAFKAKESPLWSTYTSKSCVISTLRQRAQKRCTAQIWELEVVSKFVSRNIPSYWPFSSNVSNLFFCCVTVKMIVNFSMVEKLWKLWWINSHNSATPIHMTEYSTPFPLAHLWSSHMCLSSAYVLICQVRNKASKCFCSQLLIHNNADNVPVKIA